jgi:CRP-like cAMP-binding protein
MSVTVPNTGRRVPCERCPLRPLPYFRDFSSQELMFVSAFKTGELLAEPGSSILSEGSHSAQLFTVLTGWAFRYKTLSDGRRQVLNYLLPGDLVGLQGSMLGQMEHAVEALTSVVLCVFQRDRLEDLYRNHPGLAFDVTWLASREERMLDEHLLSIGRRSAFERAAYLIAYLHWRAESVGLVGRQPLAIPITQTHVADTLGLSTVHTNKTLRKLADRKLIAWRDRSCVVLDAAALRGIADWQPEQDIKRPFI